MNHDLNSPETSITEQRTLSDAATERTPLSLETDSADPASRAAREDLQCSQADVPAGMDHEPSSRPMPDAELGPEQNEVRLSVPTEPVEGAGAPIGDRSQSVNIGELRTEAFSQEYERILDRLQEPIDYPERNADQQWLTSLERELAARQEREAPKSSQRDESPPTNDDTRAAARDSAFFTGQEQLPHEEQRTGEYRSYGFDHLPDDLKSKALAAQDAMNERRNFEPTFRDLRDVAVNSSLYLENNQLVVTFPSRGVVERLSGEPQSIDKLSEFAVDRGLESAIEYFLGPGEATVFGAADAFNRIMKDNEAAKMMSTDTLEAQRWRSQKQLEIATEIRATSLAKEAWKERGDVVNPTAVRDTLLAQYNDFDRISREYYQYISMDQQRDPQAEPADSLPRMLPGR
jgi:hypothetical protein